MELGPEPSKASSEDDVALRDAHGKMGPCTAHSAPPSSENTAEESGAACGEEFEANADAHGKTGEEDSTDQSAAEECHCDDIARESLVRMAAECAARWPEMLSDDGEELCCSKPALDSSDTDAAGSISEADLRTIRADIRRTRAKDPMFSSPGMHERLETILTRFCLLEGVRYTQGLHEIGAVFAFVEDLAPSGTLCEATALASFMAFVRKFVPYFHDSEAFIALHVTLLFFRQLVLYHHPDLHNQLEEAGVSPLIYATPWFVTLFATSRTPLLLLLELWTRYIARGEASFVPFLAVALLAGRKTAILAAQKDEANLAAAQAGAKTPEELNAVWAAAEALQARTPRSFTVRMLRGMNYVRERSKNTSTEEQPTWTERVLTRVERERQFAVMPGEVIAHCVRMNYESLPQGRACEVDIVEDGSENSSAAVAPRVPAPDLPKLRLLLLDVRSEEEFTAEHLPQAVHFHPQCIRRLIAANRMGGKPRIERLASTLSAAVASSVSGLVGSSAGARSRPALGPLHAASGGESKPPASSLPWAEPQLLGEIFETLQATAAASWGEDWLSESTGGHLVLLGGKADEVKSSGSSGQGAQQSGSEATAGAVAPLYEALTEHLSLLRVSVALGGASAVHKEAAKRGLQLIQGSPSVIATTDREMCAASGTRGSGVKEPGAAPGRLGSFFKNASGAGTLARGIAGGAAAVQRRAQESVATVRQQAAEGVSAVMQQIETATASMTQEQEVAKVTFQPGRVGVGVDWVTGRVTNVAEDGQGEHEGVQVGWIFHSVDGQPYSADLVKAKLASGSPYVVTFVKV